MLYHSIERKPATYHYEDLKRISDDVSHGKVIDTKHMSREAFVQLISGSIVSPVSTVNPCQLETKFAK